MNSRSIAHALVVTAIGSLAACASPESTEHGPLAPTDAGIDSTDVSTDTLDEPQVDAPQESDAQAPDSGDADASDAGIDAGDYCPLDADSGLDGVPCAAGAVETGRCGRCGVRERQCSGEGSWGPWSPCSESAQAQCDLCAETTVGCGFCGSRPLTCRLVEDSCRWMLGACTASGSCAPGSFQADAATCAPGSSSLRWCQSDCSWGAWEPCTDQPPAWDSLGPGVLGPRTGFVSRTTSSAWIVWGGRDPQGVALADGATFDPSSATWSLLPEPLLGPADGDAGPEGGVIESFAPRSGAASAWTGDELLVWGGQGTDPSDVRSDGARWRPSDGSWSRMSQVGAPSPRVEATMLWDASLGLAVVWGGRSANGNPAAAGGRYLVSSDAWTPIAASPLSSRLAATAVWDPIRSRMVVWGGYGAGNTVRRDGAAYDPSTDTWTPISDAPIAREGHLAVWDVKGDRMLILLGHDGFWTGQRGDGAAWSPATDSWSMLSDLSISGYAVADGWSAAFASGFVWVTGGDGAGMGSSTASAARYDVARDAWSALPTMNAARSSHAAAFVDQLLVWGGRPGSSGWVDSTERLRPLH